jgi:oligopeptide transport system substrate-binding protein
MHLLRRVFPYFAVGLLLAALVWAMSFGTLPPADFTFDNSTEIESIDPGVVTGQPEHRIINALFEGLLRNMPKDGWENEPHGPTDTVEMTPQPAMAFRPEVSEDLRTYTFRMRPGALWSDGSPVTAEDFAWSWMRTLHPETGGKYSYQLHYIVGAKKFTRAQIDVGDQVEVELADRRNRLQLFPQGTIERGTLTAIHKPPAPAIPAGANDEQRGEIEADWKQLWVFAVEVKPANGGDVDWEAAGQVRLFARDPAKAIAAVGRSMLPDLRVEPCMHVLPDFRSTVGVRAESPEELVVTLEHPAPYFLDLVAFYPLYPVNRKCVETFGSPDWTKPENLVCNGPFTMEFRRIRDRIRLVKNPRYWSADSVKLDVIDALATKSETTSLNMYLNGQLDWSTQMPISTIPILQRDFADQFYTAPELTTYFYRLNVTRDKLRDKRVRRALALAIDKQTICERITRAGEQPAGSLVPPGISGYESPPGAPFDAERARQLLADAGYPGGRGLPTIEILYNDMDAHKTIAEAIQQMWRTNLGIDTRLRALEWGVYLDTTHKLQYDVARAGWIADYADPNTFLDMFQTGNENNQTGWSHAEYDRLIREAAVEADPDKRMAMFAEAEAILLDEQPIIPIYFRVSKNLVQPHVKGFFNNAQDDHPLHLLRVER